MCGTTGVAQAVKGAQSGCTLQAQRVEHSVWATQHSHSTPTIHSQPARRHGQLLLPSAAAGSAPHRRARERHGRDAWQQLQAAPVRGGKHVWTARTVTPGPPGPSFERPSSAMDGRRGREAIEGIEGRRSDSAARPADQPGITGSAPARASGRMMAASDSFSRLWYSANPCTAVTRLPGAAHCAAIGCRWQPQLASSAERGQRHARAVAAAASMRRCGEQACAQECCAGACVQLP